MYNCLSVELNEITVMYGQTSPGVNKTKVEAQSSHHRTLFIILKENQANVVEFFVFCVVMETCISCLLPGRREHRRRNDSLCSHRSANCRRRHRKSGTCCALYNPPVLNTLSWFLSQARLYGTALRSHVRVVVGDPRGGGVSAYM